MRYNPGWSHLELHPLEGLGRKSQLAKRRGERGGLLRNGSRGCSGLWPTHEQGQGRQQGWAEGLGMCGTSWHAHGSRSPPHQQTSAVGSAPGEAAMGSETNPEEITGCPAGGATSLFLKAAGSGPASLQTQISLMQRSLLKEELAFPVFYGI